MTTNSTKNQRIVGGRNATGPIPWQIYLTNPTNKYTRCGGTIIDRRTILTAAHCFEDEEKSGVLNTTAATYDLYVGIVERDHSDNTPITLESITIHERYETSAYDDIAIIKLAKPLIFNEQVGPACLPKKSYDPKAGTECFVSGWGSEEQDQKLPSKLIITHITHTYFYNSSPNQFMSNFSC